MLSKDKRYGACLGRHLGRVTAALVYFTDIERISHPLTLYEVVTGCKINFVFLEYCSQVIQLL